MMATANPPKLGRFALSAFEDVPDFRDWTYAPSLAQLKRSIAKPRSLKILDQGEEGSCSGFGLAAVVNLLAQRRGNRFAVSPRMLYEMAKKYDEWRGEKYEGSSCRGAIKGWYNMGVCRERHWKYEDGNPGTLTVPAAKDARNNTLGAYYRLGIRISDYHAALNEVGAIYCSATVHSGWDEVDTNTDVIKFESDDLGGHAFAIVGYNKDGFWIQNSWGRRWGDNGVALWTYEDWQTNIMDAWVLRLALPTPQIWHLPVSGISEAGRGKAEFFEQSPPRASIAGHFVHLDDGRLHDHGRYWSNLDDVHATADLVADSSDYDHLLFYAHGGLNSPHDAARRIAAMKETFKDNRVYPYHFMYDTGVMEEIKDVLLGKEEAVEERAAGITDWTDRLIEGATRVPGRALWREMKHGASMPFVGSNDGAQVLVAFLDALWRAGNTGMKIHVAAHSTGAILIAYLLDALERVAPTQRVASCSLLAPASSVALFNSHYYPLLLADQTDTGIDDMMVYSLNDGLERDDNVIQIYRKSLLYLVSRAFEEVRETPLLGMQIYSRDIEQQGIPRLGFTYSAGQNAGDAATESEAHTGFDNDPITMNHVLTRVIGKTPDPKFTEDSLDY